MKLRHTDLHLAGWELYEEADTGFLYLDINKDKTMNIFLSHEKNLDEDGLIKGHIKVSFDKKDLSIKEMKLTPAYNRNETNPLPPEAAEVIHIEAELEKCLDGINETIQEIWNGVPVFINNEEKRTWNDEFKLFPEFKDGSFTREDFSPEREKEWVKFCYDSYEYDGFRDTFHSPYGDDRDGMDYEILGRISDDPSEKHHADLECLPLWLIRFPDEHVHYAGPEEICLTETPEYMNKYKKRFDFVR